MQQNSGAKRYIGIAIIVILFAIAGWILWSKLSTPLDASVQAQLQRGGVLQGTVSNDGSKTIDHAVLTVKFTDANGAPAGEDSAEFSSIPPGGKLSFILHGSPGATAFTTTLHGQSGGI